MSLDAKSKQANFLPSQYLLDAQYPINHNYLKEQFFDYREILGKIEEVVLRGDFTLGAAVNEFEESFSRIQNAKFSIGVGSGTDALMLSLKALGIGEGDEVITTPFSFFATVGAIVTAGARPVFVDVELDGYNLDANKVEQAITERTKAIVPVHWAGRMCDMQSLRRIADRNGLSIVEDACHAVLAQRDGYFAGKFSEAACFSLHPLKNLNVWGDGGVIVTNSSELASQLRLLRNHGLVDRNTCKIFAFNSRLDTIQAVVGNHIIERLDKITNRRVQNAHLMDSLLSGQKGVLVSSRNRSMKEVFHLYSILCEGRDELSAFLKKNGVDAKIHYPMPLHLQPAASSYNYKKGDLPISELISEKTLSLPIHEYISSEQIRYMADLIKQFYSIGV